MNFTIARPLGFHLRAAREFYEGFTPGSGMGAAATGRHDEHLTLAFRLDGSYEAVAVSLHEEGELLVAEAVGTDDEPALRAQLGRILGLEADGAAWRDVGQRDPIVGTLQAEFPGFFTAAPSSPYDAATWGILSTRLRASVAARIKLGMAAKYGETVRLRGREYRVFPGPERLLSIEEVPGLTSGKIHRLHAVARAAREGGLDATRLRALPEHEALRALQTLPGVGPWTASHILFRGAAPPDALPSAEPRVLHGFASAYGLETASFEQLARAAEAWRPFRMWVCVLLSRHLARAGLWHNPTFPAERAAASRKVMSRAAGEPLLAAPPTTPGAHTRERSTSSALR